MIPTEYEVVEHDYGTAYRCMISDILMIRFVTYKNNGPGIVRIGLSRIDSVTYKKGGKAFNYEATKEDIPVSYTHLTHRGYYCPDIYNTVAVGGYNRGKVLKRPTKRSKISFEFCYEKEHLILVKEFENPSLDFAQQEFIKAEFIERRGNIEIGVRLPYNRGASDEFCNEIETIHICQYDAGKLLNVRTFFAKDAHRIDKFTKMDGFEYEKTWIEYERGQVKTVHYLNYYKPDFWSKEFKSVDKITFLYNAEGLPVKYYHNNEKEWICLLYTS